MPTTVLVHEYLSGGGPLAGASADEARELKAQGRAMRDAMAADLRALPGVEVVLGRHPDFALQAETVDAVWAVAPETGGLLSQLCAAVAPASWLGSSAAAIAIAGSKRATGERLAAAGIAVPGPAGGPGPHVTKPDDGAGATDTVRFESFEAARAALPDGHVIEPWIDGEPLSLTLLCARGAELLSVNRQHVEVGAGGRVDYHGVAIAVEPPDRGRGPALQGIASAVAAALPGLFGIIGIDLVWHPLRGPVVIEVNPRVTSAYVGLSARLRRNLAAELLVAWRHG